MRFKFEQCDNKGLEQKHPASIQGGEALCIFSFSGKFYLVTLSRRNWKKSCKTVQEKKSQTFIHLCWALCDVFQLLAFPPHLADVCVCVKLEEVRKKGEGEGAYEVSAPKWKQYLDCLHFQLFDRETQVQTQWTFCFPNFKHQPRRWHVTTCANSHGPKLGRRRVTTKWMCWTLLNCMNNVVTDVCLWILLPTGGSWRCYSSHRQKVLSRYVGHTSETHIRTSRWQGSLWSSISCSALKSSQECQISSS